MKKIAAMTLVWSILAVTARASDFAEQRLDNWHQWRGPNADGIAPRGDPPVRWDEKTNIRWKVELPGAGSAMPLVWGNQVIVLSAIETDRKAEAAAKPAAAISQPTSSAPAPKRDRQSPRRRRGSRLSTPKPTKIHQFVMMCLDRDMGRLLWQRTATEQLPHEGHHPSHGYASASPTTDGHYVYASFGSRGIFCYDLEGNFKWKRDLGDMRTKLGFGEGTSPVLHGDSLIVIWDHDGDSFITCLDAKTGGQKWRVARDEQASWATPLVISRGGVTQVVTNATSRTRSYDLATGELLWQCGGQGPNAIPSPISVGDVVYCMTGFRGFSLDALPLDAKGDLTDSDRIVWRRDDAAPYIASPVIYDDLLYFTNERRGILPCADAKTGKVVYDGRRLPEGGTIYASLAAAAGRIYIIGRGGATVVIKHGQKYEVLAVNKLDEGIDASPVIVGRQLLLRGSKHLYYIEAG